MTPATAELMAEARDQIRRLEKLLQNVTNDRNRYQKSSDAFQDSAERHQNTIVSMTLDFGRRLELVENTLAKLMLQDREADDAMAQNLPSYEPPDAPTENHKIQGRVLPFTPRKEK